METNDNVIKLTFISNPVSTNVTLNIDQECDNKNDTCPRLSLKEGEENEAISLSKIRHNLPQNVQNNNEDTLLDYPETEVEITVLNPEKLMNSTISVTVTNGIGLPLKKQFQQDLKYVWTMNK